MVSLQNIALGVIILTIFAVSMLNPGGFYVALILSAFIVGLVLFVPFVQEYVLSVNKGKAARKTPDKGNGGSQRK
ncbi:hypothetical protein [Halosolutus gelatinilyticus]|uniref:hypothetical protein n=1 Tax=Halosolutus gelatinilyticus TaxID=2931975 RepID=UPI001FF4F4B8|nr:hypothetical protein [Halosolutus gelatinilyticus]